MKTDILIIKNEIGDFLKLELDDNFYLKPSYYNQLQGFEQEIARMFEMMDGKLKYIEDNE